MDQPNGKCYCGALALMVFGPHCTRKGCSFGLYDPTVEAPAPVTADELIGEYKFENFMDYHARTRGGSRPGTVRLPIQGGVTNPTPTEFTVGTFVTHASDKGNTRVIKVIDGVPSVDGKQVGEHSNIYCIDTHFEPQAYREATLAEIDAAGWSKAEIAGAIRAGIKAGRVPEHMAADWEDKCDDPYTGAAHDEADSFETKVTPDFGGECMEEGGFKAGDKAVIRQDADIWRHYRGSKIEVTDVKRGRDTCYFKLEDHPTETHIIRNDEIKLAPAANNMQFEAGDNVEVNWPGSLYHGCDAKIEMIAKGVCHVKIECATDGPIYNRYRFKHLIYA